MKKFEKRVLSLIVILSTVTVSFAQELNGVYFTTSTTDSASTQQELKVHDNYLILSVYESSPAKFIKTIGGFYTVQNDSIKVKLEFNSNYENDSISELAYAYSLKGDQLVLQSASQSNYQRVAQKEQDLDGPWLFGTRGPDTGQERRGDSRTRKTLKFLMNGRFQWIAYDTNGFQFKGTGGGSYTAVDGKYTENIEYFSRDNKRVGASLEFDYEVKDNDWHHTGNNSKGQPMYEIWQRRL